jgi:23S rRNA pseudouridine1911/1915/1917 synthase
MAGADLTVAADQAGQRLDVFLAGQLPGTSRSQIQRLIRSGQVRLDRPAQPNTVVRAGERIEVEFPPPSPAKPAAEPLVLSIIYQDSDVIVVNKPPGMVVHPGPGHQSGTLVNALLHAVTDLSGVGGELRPGIVHRLDRGTSGLMVVAKNDRAHHELARQFHDREVEKNYTALVWGTVRTGRRIEAAIGRDPRNRQKMSAKARRARSAVTRVTKARVLGGLTLLEVAIATGRTHQIRVHLSSIGHPVVGDNAYGGIRRHVPPGLRPVLRLERPFLHASRLAFAHPADGSRLEFSCQLSADLQSVLDDIERMAEGSAGEV